VKLEEVPVAGLYQIPVATGGRIVVFGDSSCIDESAHEKAFAHCFNMCLALLKFASDAHLLSTRLDMGLEKLL
jgi:membrane-bound transcription factor site-1 protease